jgi:hypothetical protein
MNPVEEIAAWLKTWLKNINPVSQADLVGAWTDFVGELEATGNVKLSLGLLGFSDEAYRRDVCESVQYLIHTTPRKKLYEHKNKTLQVGGMMQIIF